MFFILSKVFSLLTEPLFWLIFILAWAHLTKDRFKKKRLLRGGFIYVLILTNPFLAHRVFQAWEGEAVRLPEGKVYDVGILLGGFTDFTLTDTTHLNFNHAANRLTDALVLYKKGIIKKLLISGGDGRLVGKKFSEAEKTLNFLKDLGVPSEDVIIEGKSRNTHENAVFTAQVLSEIYPNASPSCLLVTSAFHMKRAKGCFDNAGLACTPYPAHFIAKRIEWTPGAIFYPDNEAFTNWQQVIKEWIGCVVYKLRGYI